MLRWVNWLPSFGKKVTLLLTLTGGLAVFLVSIGLVTFSYYDLHRDLIASVASRTQLMAMSIAAPLSFNDVQNAEEVLESLSSVRHVAAAAVYDREGGVFARYENPSRTVSPMPMAREGLSRHEDWLQFTYPVDESGVRIGLIQLVFDTEHLNKRLVTMLMVTLAISLVTIVFISALARGIQRVLVAPINHLARTARKVAATGDYALRASRTSADEIGQFTDDFNAMLAQIQQQHTELESARRAAERSSRIKDEFLATLSHELRTPMAPILGWAQMLLRNPADTSRIREGVEVIERNARVQTQLIDDLLDMSRIATGKVNLVAQPLHLKTLVEAALSTVHTAAEARDVTIKADYEPDLPKLRVDPARMQQVVWNLLTNAIKFTPRGGKVGVRVYQQDCNVAIEVSDSGQGIDAEFLPHVFERFRQADSSSTRAHGGLGLGLAIVKQLVELHGGSISAHSDGSGQGAKFTIVLPLPSSSEAVSTPPPANQSWSEQAESSLRNCSILLVEDAPDAIQLMTYLLADAGAMVHTAHSAEQALKQLARHRVDVIISDIGMPDCDGYELMQKVRSLSPDQGGRTPAIALTGFARESDRQKALQAGFQMHLSKPIDAVELVEAAGSLCRKPSV